MEISDLLVAHAFDNTRHYYLHNKVMTDASNGSSVFYWVFFNSKKSKRKKFQIISRMTTDWVMYMISSCT